ncbi:MAG TPA: fructokinase [Alphaproteobacteria bacterium]|nr:fructokinase [Alphaproteobacteria bacterium]
MRIGIDLGGTKIEAIALDGHGNERARKRIASPRGDYAATIAAIRDLVATLEAETGERGTVGIGMPGAISPATGLVKNANSTWLIGHPFGRDLEEALGREVRLANDADCFALSEATDGAAAGAASVFGVILGTGVGGGIVINGALLSGPNAIAGEWGHNSLPFVLPDEMPGPDCYCGKTGCIETFLSGPGFAARHKEQSGQSLTPEQIVTQARQGNADCGDSLGRYIDRLARATATVINILDPHCIVLGGGMSNIAELVTEVPRLWPRYVFSDRIDTVLSAARHGDASGVRGAAWLWPAS